VGTQAPAGHHFHPRSGFLLRQEENKNLVRLFVDKRKRSKKQEREEERRMKKNEEE